MIRRPPRSTLFPYPPLSRSGMGTADLKPEESGSPKRRRKLGQVLMEAGLLSQDQLTKALEECARSGKRLGDRKSTRLNSSHLVISYAVFCLKKKKNKYESGT